jgi:hypothetical protein
MTARRRATFPEPRKGGAPRSKTLDKWLDGSVWELRQGVDFQTSIHVFQGMVRKATGRRGKGFRYADLGDGRIAIQAID